ncbi:hypothetical protein JTB14_013679 [Gonioctena quinquepunctata]|nr:hypothetical protein JTB14_013679 [Gonioctena quinquepunctata]
MSDEPHKGKKTKGRSNKEAKSENRGRLSSGETKIIQERVLPALLKTLYSDKPKRVNWGKTQKVPAGAGEKRGGRIGRRNPRGPVFVIPGGQGPFGK